MVDDVSSGTRQGKGSRVAAVLVFSMLLTGCAGVQATGSTASPTSSAGPTAGTSAPTPTPTPTPTPSAPPAPTAVNPDDPGLWVIGFTSVGPLAVGAEMGAATQSMTAFTSSNIFEGCPSIVSFDKPGSPDVVITDTGENGIVRQIVLQGGVDPSGVAAGSPRTNSGIGIGATLDELITAYPTLTDLNDYFRPHYAVPDENGNWIHFAVSEGVVYTIVVHAHAFMPRELCG
ncbi:hypothetical protein [Cryobacterium cheniae]|nr:hypothetical protein [Cryobacterium cheniae]